MKGGEHTRSPWAVWAVFLFPRDSEGNIKRSKCQKTAQTAQLSSDLYLPSRLALRPKEVAEALGLSERKFRQIASRLPAVWVDSIRLYPVESLQSWLAEEADRQTRADTETADRVLAELQGDETS